MTGNQKEDVFALAMGDYLLRNEIQVIAVGLDYDMLRKIAFLLLNDDSLSNTVSHRFIENVQKRKEGQ